MVIWNILLSIFVALCCFGWLTERARVRRDIRRIDESNTRLILLARASNEYQKEYTDQAVLAHEKMAHEGYENYTTEGKVIG